MTNTCTRCGDCCVRTQLVILPSEITRIKNFIKKHNIKPCDHKPIPNKPMAFTDLVCPFLDTTNPKKRCTIYPVRPQICRRYHCKTAITKKQLTLTKEEKRWLLNAPFGKIETHMGQTFFPEQYIPKKGHFVVISELYPELFKKYGHRPFICTGNKKSIPGLTQMQVLNITDTKSDKKDDWIDVNALNIIEFMHPKRLTNTKEK